MWKSWITLKDKNPPFFGEEVLLKLLKPLSVFYTAICF